MLVERATSMATKIKTFAKQTYGGFMSNKDINEATSKPMETLLERANVAIANIDAIPDETYNQDIVDGMATEHETARKALLSSAIGQAVEMVGEELAREVAI